MQFKEYFFNVFKMRSKSEEKTCYERLARYTTDKSIWGSIILGWEWILANMFKPNDIIHVYIENSFERKLFYDLCEYYQIRHRKCIDFVRDPAYKNAFVVVDDKYACYTCRKGVIIGQPYHYCSRPDTCYAKIIQMPQLIKVQITFPRSLKTRYIGCHCFGKQYSPSRQIPQCIFALQPHWTKSLGFPVKDILKQIIFNEFYSVIKCQMMIDKNVVKKIVDMCNFDLKHYKDNFIRRPRCQNLG